jgi:hypothetical protein
MARPRGFLSTSLFSAVLSAGLVLILFGARSTSAGDGARKHDAASAEVALDGSLVKDGGSWLIKFRAINTGSADKQCNFDVDLTSITESGGSRVGPIPKSEWKTTVALAVPRFGVVDHQLAVPAGKVRQPSLLRRLLIVEDWFAGDTRWEVDFAAKCEAKISGRLM